MITFCDNDKIFVMESLEISQFFTILENFRKVSSQQFNKSHRLLEILGQVGYTETIKRQTLLHLLSFLSILTSTRKHKLSVALKLKWGRF